MDSPSIVPDPLANLIALIDQYAMSSDEWDQYLLLDRLEAEERAIADRAPHLKRLAHAAVKGIRRVKSASNNGKRNGGRFLGRNIIIAMECVKRRRDPAYDHLNDTKLMAHVGALRSPPLKRNTARDAVLSVICRPDVQAEIKKSSERKSPDSRRSIFDGSKKVST